MYLCHSFDQLEGDQNAGIQGRILDQTAPCRKRIVKTTDMITLQQRLFPPDHLIDPLYVLRNVLHVLAPLDPVVRENTLRDRTRA